MPAFDASVPLWTNDLGDLDGATFDDVSLDDGYGNAFQDFVNGLTGGGQGGSGGSVVTHTSSGGSSASDAQAVGSLISTGLNDVLNLVGTAAQLDPNSPINRQQQQQAAALQQQYQNAAQQAQAGSAAAQQQLAQLTQLIAQQQAQTQAMLAEQQGSKSNVGLIVGAIAAGVVAVVGVVVALVRR